MRIYHNLCSEFITIERLFQAWEGFIKGKKKKEDVILYQRFLEDNLFKLYFDLKYKRYKHGGYESFFVRDPKIRHIHKAQVKDRVVHHLVSKVLENIFDPMFYSHSYSCRLNKGTHKGIETLVKFARKASRNNTSSLFILKCDIKKFFPTVDHEVLLRILQEKIKDQDFINLLQEIIASFVSEYTIDSKYPKGMPIGNLTSQIFANIYLDPLDKFIKETLKVKYYIRYADDFIVMHQNRSCLENLLPEINNFLSTSLKLSLHPNKIHLLDYYLGVDFLGYIVFPNFILPRTKTKRRMFKKIYQRVKSVKLKGLDNNKISQTLQSYLGYLSHADSFKLSEEVKNQTWFWLKE